MSTEVLVSFINDQNISMQVFWSHALLLVVLLSAIGKFP